MKRGSRSAILLFCVFGLFNFVTISNAKAAQLAYWNFEQNLNDSSGSPVYNLSASGSYAYVNDPADPATGSYSLNDYNLSSYVYSSLYTPQNNFSVEFYFKRANAAYGSMIIGNEIYTGGLYYGWRIYIQSDGILKAQVVDGNDYYQVADSIRSYNDNEWHYVAFSLSDTNLLTMYIDDTFIGSKQGTFDAPSLTGVQMGSGPSGAFAGRLDDVIIWDEDIFAAPAVPEPLTVLLIAVSSFFAVRHKSNRKMK